MPRLITALAPVRICDCGGWTDTWFAGHGQVFSTAVSPYVEVRIAARAAEGGEASIEVHAANLGQRFRPAPGPPWQADPLIEATIAHIGVPPGTSVVITIHSEMPAGAATGTSAAVVVALIGALARLSGQRLDAAAVARTAHHVEAQRLGRQSGIQDQLAAAFGGVNFIEMPAYPHASVSRIDIAPETWRALDEQLLLVYLGRSHDSSDVHQQVIESLRSEQSPGHAALDRLRRAAVAARDAVAANDLARLGQAMCENTEAQTDLHPGLVSDAARVVFLLARARGALGWKVNGAGGDGGSLTVLTSSDEGERRRLAAAVSGAGEGWRVIPTRLSPDGLHVREE